MLEVMKQAMEALEVEQTVYLRTKLPAPEYLTKAITSLRQAIAELERQEPVAWMHIMDNTEGIKANGAGIVSITQKRKHPFGKVGIDFSKSYPVTSTPLYAHPSQRTWLGLTDEEIEQGYETTGHYQTLRPQDRFAVYALSRAIEAKLKEKNT